MDEWLDECLDYGSNVNTSSYTLITVGGGGGGATVASAPSPHEAAGASGGGAWHPLDQESHPSWQDLWAQREALKALVDELRHRAPATAAAPAGPELDDARAIALDGEAR
jgi:hypothetical protein